MCGIAGKLNFNGRPITKKEIKIMADTLAHRGPDDEGVFVDGPLGMGHRRLSIVDLSAAGHQPMADKDGRFWITYNGEIYNFPELKKKLEKRGYTFHSQTDTEVILYLYKIHGVNCLQYLRGMFALAIWDAKKRELFLARDRVGQKPLKYYCDQNTFIFASELKAILTQAEVKKEIDFEAVDEFLTYKYVPAPKTGFKNIYKLPPAHYLIVKPDGRRIRRQYWDLNYQKKANLTKSRWEEKITAALIESAKLRLIGDVPLGVHLSGGIDSGLIVALISKELGQKVKTFSIGFAEGYSELPFARLVADKYKTDHYEFIIKPDAVEILPQLVYHYEEPYADASALPSWYLARITREKVTVALNGDGGDENFAGYQRYIAMKLNRRLARLPAKATLKFALCLLSRASKNKILGDACRLLTAHHHTPFGCYLNIISYFGQKEKTRLYTDSLKQLASTSNWREASKKYFDKGTNLNWLEQILYTGLHTHLPDDLLVKVDIASMAHGLEARSPFLDHHLLSLSAQMPARLKLAGYNKKYILKKIAAKYLPRPCFNRRKQGFVVPLAYWFRGQLEPYIKDNLLNPEFLSYGFNKNYIAKIIQDHTAGRQNYENQLWTLLMLRLWLKQWFT